VLTVL